MPSFTDPDTVFRGTTGALVPATWTDTVNDDLNALYGPGTWTSLSSQFNNGWGNFSGYTVQAMILGQVMYLDGLMSGGSLNVPALDFVGIPNCSNSLLIPVTSNHAFGDIRINSIGQLIVVTGDPTWVSLTGISFIVQP